MTANASSSPPDSVLVASSFRFETDSFSFANETVWNYVDGKVAARELRQKSGQRLYTRRCFVMSRATVQFLKFAQFSPDGVSLTEKELVGRIRQVTGRSVWKPPLPMDRKIHFPGYRSLREISAAHAGIFQAHIGLGWPIYFRIGNFPIIIPMDGRAKSHVNDSLLTDLQSSSPTILWLYNFPKLDINHAVVVFAAESMGHQIRYSVADPNYTDAPKTLLFDLPTQQFLYQSTFYFPGGSVTARPVYRGYFE